MVIWSKFHFAQIPSKPKKMAHLRYGQDSGREYFLRLYSRKRSPKTWHQTYAYGEVSTENDFPTAAG